MKIFDVVFKKHNYFRVPVLAEDEQEAEGIAYEQLSKGYFRYHIPAEENLEVISVDEQQKNN